MSFDPAAYHIEVGDTTDLVTKLNDALDAFGGAVNNSLPANAVTTDIDWGASDYHTKTQSGDTTYTFSGIPSGVSWILMRLTVTSGTPTWPGSVIWEEGITPTFTASKTHLIMFLTEDGGTTVRAIARLNFAS